MGLMCMLPCEVIKVAQGVMSLMGKRHFVTSHLLPVICFIHLKAWDVCMCECECECVSPTLRV